jgi:sugar (pentulose or hexulose) kinase
VAESWLGLDFGSSGARAVVIGREAEVLAEVRLDWGKPDPERLAQDWRETLFELISQIPFNYRAELKAVAIDGTSSTALLCDAENRLPITSP